MLRHLVEVRLGHLDEITEHGVEPHFERGDAGFFRLLFLELGDPGLALGRAPAQLVERRVKAFADDAAVLDRQRWFSGDRPRNQAGHLGQFVQLAAQLAQQRRLVVRLGIVENLLAQRRRDGVDGALHLGDHAAQHRQLAKRAAQLHQVAGVAGADAQPADRPLKIANFLQAFAEPVERRAVVEELANRRLPPPDRLDRRERLREPVAQQPRAHRRRSAVQRGVKRPRLAPLAMQRLENLEVLQRRGIEHEGVGHLVKPQPREVRHVAPQVLADVMQRAAGRTDRRRAALQPEAVERGDLKMILQRELRRLEREHPVFVAVEYADIRLDRCGQALRLFRINHLTRVESLQLGKHGVLVFQLGDLEIAGRQIDRRHTKPTAGHTHGDEKIVAAGLEHSLVEVRARAEDLRDLALDQLPRLGRLDLVTDRHLAPGLEQLGEVIAGGVVGDPTHRHVAALGQRDIENAGRLLRVLEKHLVKIPEAKQQNRPSRQLAFALPVLGHHRCEFRLLWHAQTLIAEPNAVEGKISTTAKPR